MQNKKSHAASISSASVAEALNQGLKSSRKLVAALNHAIVGNGTATTSAKRSASERPGSRLID